MASEHRPSSPPSPCASSTPAGHHPSLRDLAAGTRLSRFSHKEIDRLGERLRSDIRPADLHMLGLYRDEHLGALAASVVRLAGVRFKSALTARQKNAQTIIAKLRDKPKMELSNMQDIAGARIIVAGGLRAQNAAVLDVQSQFPRSKDVRDRRGKPTTGYRAVHVIVQANDCWAEIQVRTPYQDRWAQTFERLGDYWGRQIRYGGQPDDPERTTMVAGAPVSRIEVVEYMLGLSEMIDDVETEEERVHVDTDELAKVVDALAPEKRARRLDALSVAQHKVQQGFRDIDSMFEALGEAVPMTARGDIRVENLAPSPSESPPHFLIAYKRSTGELLQVRTFLSGQVQEAVAIREALEQEHRTDRDFEVVLFASHSEDELRRTHSRYFKNLGQLIKADQD